MNLSNRTSSFPSNHNNLTFFHSLLKHSIETRPQKSPLLIYRHLLQYSLNPNDFTFSLLLKASSSSSSSSTSVSSSTISRKEADQIHSQLLKSAIDNFVYVKTALLDLRMKLGCVDNAQKLFDEMRCADLVAWNALICGYTRNGYDLDAFECFVEMLREGFFLPHEPTLVGLIPSCGRRIPMFLFRGKSIHAFGIKLGLDADSKVKNAFASMYAKCGDLEATEVLFGEMIDKNVVSWNTMITAFGQNGLFKKAAFVFKQMLEEGNVEPNPITITTVLSANAQPNITHCFATKTGLTNDEKVTTSLICSYARHDDLTSAERLYGSSDENLVALTAILSCYAEKGDIDMVVACFRRMRVVLNVNLDDVAMVTILHGFRDDTCVSVGVSFHCYAMKTGLCTHSLVSNGLITMYSKFNDIETVFSLFSDMRYTNIETSLISWNSVISACVQTGNASDAMEMFHRMMSSQRCCPDTITIVTMLTACSQLGDVKFGTELHGYVLRNNLETEETEEDFVGTALIDMYAKCGNIERSENVFKTVENPCLATWNAMISGYGLSGYEREALFCYAQLQERGLKPDTITFLGVLAACTHAGLVDEGKRYFKTMTSAEFRLEPTLQHCACMVGLLGRAGLFEEALRFIRSMEVKPDSAVLGALLSACCIHKEVEFGEYVAKKMYLLGYENRGLYVLVSNLYASKGLWDDVARVREMMKGIGRDGYLGVSHVYS